MKNKFPIVEIFDSIDGEGKRTGYMAIFVRFAGCNIRCTYCDTCYALTPDDAVMHQTEDELYDTIHRYPWKRITFTGGEPLLQPIENLCHKLSKEGYDINIETNGAVPLLQNRPENLFYTMDYKCPGSGVNAAMRLDNFEKLTEKDVLKFVVGDRRDLDDMKRIIETHFKKQKPKFYVSPVWGKIKPVELVEYVKENRLHDVCVQVQLHKIIWSPTQKGV